jgi:S1-C subfamily serine protease
MKPITALGCAFGTFSVVFAGVLAALNFDRQRHSSPVQLVEKPPIVLQGASAGVGNGKDFREPAQRALQSAVSIQTIVRQTDFFGEDLGLRPYSMGSGVVISKDGYIVTNNHVVRAGGLNGPIADKVVVHLSTGKSYDAKVVGADPKADIAVIKLDGVEVTPIELGDSSKLVPGQWVMAVGNPLGLENSVTLGIVSSLGRQLAGDGTRLFIDGIQTDAAINMGNSGGPLVDDQARLVGINSSIARTDQYSSGNIGIGFAIPVNRMKQVVDDLIKFGRVKYGAMVIDYNPQCDGYLGNDETRDAYRQQFGALPPRAGMIVARVAPGGPAAQAGIKFGDVITHVQGREVTDPKSFLGAVATGRPGDVFKVTVFSGGKTREVSVTLSEAR